VVILRIIICPSVLFSSEEESKFSTSRGVTLLGIPKLAIIEAATKCIRDKAESFSSFL
jgi:hypothetical protein